MKRRQFITLLGAVAASVSPLAARAQAAKIYRVGILETISAISNAANFDALRKGMRALGYVEGQNLLFEYRSADGRNERFPDLVAELVRLRVDLIVTRSTPAVISVKAATTTIPTVMAATANPVADGIVASLARPGGNITGLSSFHSELSTKRLELLRDLIPRIARIATISDPSNPVTSGQEEDVSRAAQPLGIVTRFSEPGTARSWDRHSKWPPERKWKRSLCRTVPQHRQICGLPSSWRHSIVYPQFMRPRNS
jgi:putative ABC transport system substrate-binding protein